MRIIPHTATEKDPLVDSIFVKADVSKPEEVKHYVDKPVERFGTIDYFFNNAGISGSGTFFLNSTIEEINQIVGVNLMGVLYGIIGLTKSMVAEYAKHGLRINAIAPGPTETPMVKSFYAANPEMKANATRGIPQKRLGTPEEVAELTAGSRTQNEPCRESPHYGCREVPNSFTIYSRSRFGRQA
ncbi:SDR family NAD(P)-dependent oxidoreductase [Paenibacillus sp. S-38]|uniref:SDR family NAD(P)-dependent oxidoreductase n=1 Tax=Paenibacillus sp. S-38 TaxID=3416710 RepID=UPI003CF2F401